MFFTSTFTPLPAVSAPTPPSADSPRSTPALFLGLRNRSTPDALPDVDFACLAAGDFNIHNHAVDPLRVISCAEEKASTPYFNQAADLAYFLLNTPGVYTRFPLSCSIRPSAIELAYTNPLMRPAFRSWDSTTLPSTGSDHVPILINLAAPTDERAPPQPMWDKAD